MTAVSFCPVPKLQFNQNGIPLSGGKLYTYSAGTTTKLATYTSSTGSTPNTNPIILDSNGQCDLFLNVADTYKLVLSPSTDSDPPTNPFWIEDNVYPMAKAGPLSSSGITGVTASAVGAIDVASAAIVAVAGGTSDAITATFTPNVTSLTNGLRVSITGCSANVTPNPSFATGTTAYTGIVKGANLPLFLGDINGVADLEYSAAYGAWVLLNPSFGITPNKSSIFTITATVASNTLGCSFGEAVLDFRSATLGSGTINTRTITGFIGIEVPQGATLGTVSTVLSRLYLLAIDNEGTIELAIVNPVAGLNLDESTLISTTSIINLPTSANVIYSITARMNVPFRIVGYVESTQATAGTWATAPSRIQGFGGNTVIPNTSINSLIYDGYQILPGGLYLQWGNSVTTSGSTTITFPVPFPNNCLMAIANANVINIVAVTSSISKTGFTALTNTDSTGSVSSSAFYWFALGN